MINYNTSKHFRYLVKNGIKIYIKTFLFINFVLLLIQIGSLVCYTFKYFIMSRKFYFV